MGDSVSKVKTKKSGWFSSLKGEFKKIIWPDKKTIASRTTTVVLISIFLGVVIKVADLLIMSALRFINLVM